MKKIIISLFVIIGLVGTTFADYYQNSIESFINSPSKSELASIEDENLAYCEQVFLEAYMRREFTEAEDKKCSDIFEQKIEAQLNYMKSVSGNRGNY